MKRIIFFLLILLSVIIYAQIVKATVTISPSSVTTPRGLSTTKSIAYNIIGSLDCTLATSASGQFISGANVLGTVNTAIPVTLTGTGAAKSGTATETLIIPIKIIKRAEQLNVNTFQYRRVFAFSGCSSVPPDETINVQIKVTTEAGAEFKVTRLQLYFENRKAEITIRKNQPSPRAYADIRFIGSGLLQGYWEVDGRILSNVQRHIVYGRSITIETPDVPPFPTFQTGTHRVRFIITNPSQDIPFPEAIYFVTAEEFREILSINLVFPQDKSEVNHSPITFSWEEKDRTITYIIEFLEKDDEKPIFSAYIRKADYELPHSVLKSIFAPGKTYLWRVKGFDTNNNKAGESALYRFTLGKLAS